MDSAVHPRQLARLLWLLSQHLLREADAFDIGAPRELHVPHEMLDFVHEKRLRTVAERVARARVHVDDDAVGAHHDTLCGDVVDVHETVRAEKTASDGVRWIHTYGQPRQTPHDGYMRKIHEVAVRVAEIRPHATEAKDDAMVAARRHVLARVERFLER